MTENDEDIDEKVNRLEKSIEELQNHVIVSLPPKENRQVQEEGRLQVAKEICMAFGITFLFILALLHLVWFVCFSYRMLDFNIANYVNFIEDNMCRFYRLFGYCRKSEWRY